jgi:hypothetical protein
MEKRDGAAESMCGEGGGRPAFGQKSPPTPLRQHPVFKNLRLFIERDSAVLTFEGNGAGRTSPI